MNKSTFEEQLAQNGKLIYTNKGDSMIPLIKQDRDLLIIEPANGRLKKYDVPLYKRDSGQYVLHRILKVREDDYVMHIIGVLTAVVRDDKEISVNNWKYKLYVHLWCDMFPIRAFIVHAVNKIKRIIRR